MFKSLKTGFRDALLGSMKKRWCKGMQFDPVFELCVNVASINSRFVLCILMKLKVIDTLYLTPAFFFTLILKNIAAFVILRLHFRLVKVRTIFNANKCALEKYVFIYSIGEETHK